MPSNARPQNLVVPLPHQLGGLDKLAIKRKSTPSVASKSSLRVQCGELVGTGFLVAAVVGSGIMADRLSGMLHWHCSPTQLPQARRRGLDSRFGPISGYLNPVVSVADAMEAGCAGMTLLLISGSGWWRLWRKSQLTQCSDCRCCLCPIMLGADLLSSSASSSRFGLLSVIWGCSQSRSSAVPFAVGSYITAAYWFTASTSFANPAVTIARAFSATFAGIRPIDVPLFVVAQITGGIAATLLFRWLIPNPPVTAKSVMLPNDSKE